MDLEDRLERRVEKVVLRRRRVLDRDLVLTSADVQDRGAVEKVAEPLGVDGRRHDDDLEICRFALARVAVGLVVLDLLALLGVGRHLGFPPLLDVLQEPHEHVGAEAALVRLVEDDDVVRVEVAVAQHLGEQGAVGRVLEAGGATRAVVEPDRVADEVAEGDAGFSGDALGERDGGDSPRLGADDPRAFARGVGAEEELGDLCRRGVSSVDFLDSSETKLTGGLAGSGLGEDDDGVVVADTVQDGVLACSPSESELVSTRRDSLKLAAAWTRLRKRGELSGLT